MIDLDLDVVRRRATGLVELRDEDEFAEHRARFGYPDDVVAEAQAAAGWLLAHSATAPSRSPPQYRKWLSAVLD